MNAWSYLFIAGLFEIIWSSFLKGSHGFSKFLPSVLTIVFMLGSFLFLAKAMKTIPLGSAYAAWTGIGTAGSFLAGVLIFGEQLSWLKLICIILILLGIIGLKNL